MEMPEITLTGTDPVASTNLVNIAPISAFHGLCSRNQILRGLNMAKIRIAHVFTPKKILRSSNDWKVREIEKAA